MEGGERDRGEEYDNMENEERDMQNHIAGYRILNKLGIGATSRVYLVKKEADGKVYALKHSIFPERLQTEAEILRELKHSCFPVWIEDGRLADGAYLVMEYIQGITLSQLMERYPGGMPEKMAMGIAWDVVLGLAYLHDCQPPYVYRDLKADNVIVTAQGRARLVDVGAAVRVDALQRDRCRAGTYGYSAPEQFWEGARVTPSCDIYAVGKLLSYLLTGQNPCKPPYDTAEYCSRHSGIRRGLKRLLNRCLQTDPQLRYPDASFLLQELENLGAKKIGFRDKIREITGNKRPYRYIKCIWRSDYERIF